MASDAQDFLRKIQEWNCSVSPPSESKGTRQRRRLWEAASERCEYCGDRIAFELATIDHIFPRSRGGTQTASNLACCCKSCNTSKADSLLSEVSIPKAKHIFARIQHAHRAGWSAWQDVATFVRGDGTRAGWRWCREVARRRSIARSLGGGLDKRFKPPKPKKKKKNLQLPVIPARHGRKGC